MDYYNLCKALSYNMESMLLALVMYDIMCQYGIHFIYGESGEKSRAIHSFLSGDTGIELFQNHGHQDSCLPQFPLSYISL